MRVKRAFTSLATTLTVLMLLASTALVSAQEAAETVAPAAEIQGVGTLFLLMGLGAVGLVSVVWLARERSAREENESNVS